ncbi:hypothetical protein CONPUDRAFT_84285 [Coniophora puteana RWD-64-598 SS2]|uniref:CENP-V/GFA domain-containing protein n=1 Tax=Coniophora puteana (strain RWD-64-598) TaxID=741705 RepID=A0A5M3MFV8_CONPW|nr:uncharacterized protein CONPUDRAFT_84285 [Coniophora puteana RWD-64-598 SS2]EIW77481.1 hypothetical protein CONPUDRAFT_84285 [Coniophora puteana RWD-64-598 SS2]
MSSQAEGKLKAHGSCLCKAVRYELNADAEVLWYNLCHCKDCQKASGSAFMANPGFSKTQSEYKITQGEAALGIWTVCDTTSGKPVARYFCTKCGSPIKLELPLSPHHERETSAVLTPEELERLDYVIIPTGTLDDPVEWTPQQEIFCKDRFSWLKDVQLDIPHVLGQ